MPFQVIVPVMEQARTVARMNDAQYCIDAQPHLRRQIAKSEKPGGIGHNMACTDIQAPRHHVGAFQCQCEASRCIAHFMFRMALQRNIGKQHNRLGDDAVCIENRYRRYQYILCGVPCTLVYHFRFFDQFPGKRACNGKVPQQIAPAIGMACVL